MTGSLHYTHSVPHCALYVLQTPNDGHTTLRQGSRSERKVRAHVTIIFFRHIKVITIRG